MIKQAIIPLAGLGTRLLPLTSVFAKELLPINGKPGIQYILDECIEAGIKEVVFIISKKKQMIKNYFYNDSFYKKIINKFATPIMIYKPNSNLKGIDYRLASHMDIYPSFAELIGYDKPFRSWGKSLFSEYSGDEYVINYFGGGS